MEPAAEARRFPPRVLREYALVADGERGALVGAYGEMCWMCFPRWHSDAVFAGLVGGRGVYAVSPQDRWNVWGGYYEAGSLVWRSRWVTGDSVLECHEALAFPGERQRAVVLRRVVAVEGQARVRVVLDLAPGYGRSRLDQLGRDGEVWFGQSGQLRFRWSGAADARREPDGALVALRTVPQGQYADLVLEIGDGPLRPEPVDPEEAWQRTRREWQATVPSCSDTITPRDARHAYAVLTGLTSQDGGMVAAATTSIPERADTGRNYDYRYAWIRDQCYAGQAAGFLREPPLFDNAVRFVAARLLEDGPGLRPAYTCSGRRIPDERTLPLPGYPGGFTKTGNWVTHQFQLDTFGEALQLFADAARVDRLDSDGWRAVAVAVDAIGRCWRRPDSGLWELDTRRWTHSRLACVAGLRAVAAAGRGRPEVATADTLVDWILADTTACSLHPSGRWQRSPSDSRVDSALLLPAVRGALPADDPRTVATLRAVADELVQDGYLYRYRPDERPLGHAEGAFLLCGFIMALAQHQQGRPVEATRWFERNRASCGPPGLFAEEYDVAQRQLRGNIPQAFVHAMMLECAARLPASHPADAGPADAARGAGAGPAGPARAAGEGT